MKHKAQINAVFGADIKQFSTAMQNVQRKLKNTGQQMQTVGKSMSTFVTLPLAGLGAAAVKSAADMETLKVSLQTALGGTKQQTEQAYKAIEQFAAKTPYALEEVMMGFVKLKNMGLDPSMEALESYGNTSSAMGKSLNQMVEAVADAAVGEFERLKEFGIKAKSQGDQVSFTFKGVTTTVKKNSKEIEEYLQNIGNTEFAGGIEAQSKTLNGQISTLKDNFKLLAAEFGQVMMPIVKGLSERLLGMAQRFRELSPATKRMIVIIGGLIAVVGPLLVGLGSVMTAASALLPVFLAMAGAIGPVVAVLGGLYLGYKVLTHPINNVVKAQTSFIANLAKERTEMNSLFTVLKNTTKGTKGRAEAIKKVNEKYGEYLPNLLNEKSNIKEIEAAQRRANDALMKNIFIKSKAADIQKIEEKGFEDTKDALEDLNRLAEQATSKSSGYVKRVSDGTATALSMGLSNVVEKFRGQGLKKISNEMMKISKEMGVSIGGSFDVERVVAEILNAEINRHNALVLINKEYEKMGRILGINESKIKGIETNTNNGNTNAGVATGGSSRSKRSYTPIKVEPKAAQDVIEVADAIDRATKAMGEMSDAQEVQMQQTREWGSTFVNVTKAIRATVEQALADTITYFAEQIGRTLADSSLGFDNFGKKALESIAAFAQQLGQIMIGLGTAQIALKTLALAPGAAIAAGAALVAGAAYARQMIKEDMPEVALANGGLVYGPTLSLVGDNPGAQYDPEVVAPLSKLSKMMGGGTVVMETRLKGDDIYLQQKRRTQYNNRVR